MPGLRRYKRCASVLLRGDLRQQVPDLAAEIRRHAFQAANRNGFAVHAFPAACRLTRSITRTTQNPRKDIGFPVEQIGVGVSALRDQANVLGDIRVGRARPLTIHNFMEVLRVLNVGRFHDDDILYPFDHLW